MARMNRSGRKKTDRDIPAALERLRRQWNRVPEKPGLDRIAKAAAMSNNSVLDLTAPEDSSRHKDLVERLTAGGRPESNARIWARLTMQLALALGKGSVENWLSADEWGLSPEEFASLLDEAKAKINRAEEQLSGLVSAERARVGIVQLVFLADDTRPKRQQTDTTRNASFLGAFARMALRSVKPRYEFEYYPVELLSELNPRQVDGASRAVKVGVFGIVARERETFEHIPIPGWRYKFACMGPDIEGTRRAALSREVFSGNSPDFVYLSVEDSSPASFLQSMFGGSLTLKSLRCNYSADDIAAAYVDELNEAKWAIAGKRNGPVPLLVIDEAMADEVARQVTEPRYASALSWSPPRFIDLLRDLPEGPTVPICIQVHRDDKDLIRLLNHAVIDERSQPGELFTLGALATARTYARAIVWFLSRYAYDYAQGPGVPAADSILSRLQAHYRQISSPVNNQPTEQPPRIPAFCRLWSFDRPTAPPSDFVHLLADELVSRLIPRESYELAVRNSTDQGAAVKAILRLILPSDWHPMIDGDWTRTRFGAPSPLVHLPGPQDDWRDGPADADLLTR